VRVGGPKPEDNPRLALAIDKARAANMPKETVQRAIDRASGAGGGEDFEELLYEGYGPSGVALLVEALTDNRNRTGGEVRMIFDRNGGSIGATGSVAWMFERKGILEVLAADTSEEQLFEVAVEAGAQDVVLLDEGDVEERFLVTCEAGLLDAVKGALAAAGVPTARAEHVFVPRTLVEADETTARAVMRIQGLLEDQDDVQAVTTNLDVPEDVAARLTAE
jgi:YebC/PmpR family DNA-binding regulatory protein